MPESTPFFEPPSFRVSAVLLTYNQVDAVRRALVALEKTTPREQLEIIVADCASTDGTSKIDSEFPSVQILRLPHHIGAARAWNIAVRTARADMVLFLSPDVEVLPETVSALADALEADTDTVAGCPLLVDANGQPTPRLYRLPDPANMTAHVSPAEPDLSAANPQIEYPSFDALLVRKQFIAAMNFFDQRYGHYWVDAEFAMQARRASKKIRLYPSVRAVLHSGPDPLAGNSLAQIDKVLGAAEFAGKYGGGSTGLRIRSAVGALARFDIGGFFSLLSGQKLDGTQGS